MIVFILTYKKQLAEVDAVLIENIAFLDHYYEQRKLKVLFSYIRDLLENWITLTYSIHINI